MFSEEGGVIDIRTTQSDGLLCIAVKDNGIGIALEKHHLIFKPFQQVDDSIARRRQGTGLGLALTKHLADRKSTRLNSSHITPSRMPSSA